MKISKKQIEQNKRLLNCDFPWLWGIRSFWNLLSNIKVVNADQTIVAFTNGGFFGLPFSLLSSSSKNVYIYYENKDGFGTLHIEPGMDETSYWAGRILEMTPQDSTVLNIIIDESDITTVYRIKRKNITFREMLMQIIPIKR